MKRIRKQNGSGQGGGTAAFVICSVFLLLGAAAGCFSGSYVDSSGAAWEAERGFAECLAGNLLAVGAALLLGSSCIGFFLLPLLSAASGFVSGFAMSAAIILTGSWDAAFLYCGWFIALALPVFTVLCACAMRASAAAMGLIAFGARPQPDTVRSFIKMLMISIAAAVLLAVAAAAV